MDNMQRITLQQFCLHYQAEPTFIEQLQEYGLIEIISEQNERYIALDCIVDIEKFMRLHYDMDINLPGIDAIRHLLKQMEEMQRELQRLKNRLNRHEE